MTKKLLLNSKGITLIELLASLAIFSIILVLVSSVLLNSFDYFEISKKKVSLSQEANIILTEITNLHQTKDKYTLSFDPTQHEFMLDGKLVGNNDFEFVVRAGATNYEEFVGQFEVMTDEPLFIELKIINPANSQDYTVKTVINRY